MIEIPSPLRLRLSTEALMSNWRWLSAQGNAAQCGAAVKANAYGLGATEVVQHLARAGCRHFFVATWAEAAALEPVLAGAELSVLHGLGVDDYAAAAALSARPVLSSAEQIQRWRQMGTGRACDVMVDTGMNRLGVRVDEVLAGVTEGLNIVNCLSHLSCADEDEAVSSAQLAAFLIAKAHVNAQRFSLVNSAGICLGTDYHFDLMRPGVSLYGGVVHPMMRGNIRQVVTPEGRVLQVRDVPKGEVVGYGGIWRAERDSRVAVINMGYADGYLRCHTGLGTGQWRGHDVPSIGRVSMDLLAFDVTDCEGVVEGDWVSLSYDLEKTANRCGLSQYELLTTLGTRFARIWE